VCVCVCEQLKATESTHTSRYTHTSAALKDCGTPVCKNMQDLGLTTEQRISEVMGHILLCVCVCVCKTTSIASIVSIDSNYSNYIYSMFVLHFLNVSSFKSNFPLTFT